MTSSANSCFLYFQDFSIKLLTQVIFYDNIQV